MKLLAISIALFLPSSLLFAQHILDGKVFDAETKKPVDYVNIGIGNKAKGTVSDDDGSFRLVLGITDINDRDTLNFLRIGYKTLKFSTKDLRLKLHENPIIPMEESLYELEEIVLNDGDARKNRIGYNSTSKKCSFRGTNVCVWLVL